MISLQVLFEPLPVMHLRAVNSVGGRDVTRHYYECPIYRKPSRTDRTFVESVGLKTSASPDHWVLRAVALLCSVK